MVFRRELVIEGDFDNTGDSPLKAPGFDYAVDFQLPHGDRFAHGANDFKQYPPLTAKEVAMLGVMNALTDKPDWNEKVFDDEITTKWGEEARTMPPGLMSAQAWEWCLLELRGKAARFQKTGRVRVLDAASRVCKSDTNIPDTLSMDLRVALEPLLGRPDDEKDWHPGSEGQVLDIVHPSLYPLVFGKSRVLTEGGTVPLEAWSPKLFEDATVAPQPPLGHLLPKRVSHMSFNARPRGGPDWAEGHIASNKFQWLPCEVAFREDTGTEVEITSYINNLHPKHKDIYSAIEKIIALAIPAWNDVLVHGGDGRTPPRIRTYGAQFEGNLPAWSDGLADADKNRRSDPEAYREARKKVAAFCGSKDRNEEDEEQDEGEEIDIDDKQMSSTNESEFGPEFVEEMGLAETVWEYHKRYGQKLIHPEPGVSFTYQQWKVGLTGKGVVPPRRSIFRRYDDDPSNSRSDHDYYSLRIQDDFREEGLQVIVKLASIELTPEEPTYAGGGWHVEGMLNERIVATALYYYDVENVSEARLSFRTETSFEEVEMRYEQSEHRPLAEIFGVRSGRLYEEDAIQVIGSVNTPQSRLLTFPNTLQHKVEPSELVGKSRPGHRRFLALWLVDPQYRICSTRNVSPQQEDWWKDVGSDDGSLPQAEFMMSLEEAKRLRLDLMAERTRAVEKVQQGLDSYNFCEH